MEKIAWDGPKWGREDFFPTNPDLADILGRTDLIFDDVYLFSFFGPHISGFPGPTILDFPKSGFPGFPKSGFPGFPKPHGRPGGRTDGRAGVFLTSEVEDFPLVEALT